MNLNTVMLCCEKYAIVNVVSSMGECATVANAILQLKSKNKKAAEQLNSQPYGVSFGTMQRNLST